ncbi:DUF2726 domain-containing protein [Paraglaciecola hydrolytica]|uniref:QueD like protein n=1 Tax=Paraglaciecola hydrolytica TaxID=1799789 RepID=A0A136A1Z7_9ALTE|nr:DUF2726 domain-containing protein [Paraglaciecola hydrolytica]KXI29256.1 QueD like protein [Paraglaciecola hydrolytica]
MELAILLMVLVIIVAVCVMKLNEPQLAFPFKKKTNLFTQVERNFLALIEDAVGKDYRILCRVKLVDILAVRQSTDKKTSKNAVSKANSRYLDFVLCSKTDMTPVLAIDLVHNNGKDGYKTQRDWFVNGSLDAASIPHVRIKVRSGYKTQDIKDCIEAKLPSKIPKQLKAPIMQGTLNLPEELKQKAKPTRPVGRSVIAA